MASEPDGSRWDRGYATGRRQGYELGCEHTRQQVLAYLNREHMKLALADRNSPEAKAAYRIASEVAFLLHPSRKRNAE